jgi:hypothetical protein
MHLVTDVKRHLASWLVADQGRADRRRSRQNTARANAAGASATMRQRRQDRDDVEEYLETHGGADAS